MTVAIWQGQYRKIKVFIFFLHSTELDNLSSLTSNTMTFSVSIQASSCHKILTTDVALKGSLSRVVTFVDGEGWQLCEALPTLITAVRAFTSVHSFVNAQVIRLVECLTTYITHIWFLAYVGAAMCSQWLLTCNSFPTNVTLESIFSWVRLHMCNQSLPVTKTFTTRFTLIILQFLIGSRMFCFTVVIKVITTDKPFAINITFKGSLPCMYIFMLLQKIFGIKSFITNMTLDYVLTKVSFLVNF
jgi:hypothetical protein